MIDHFALAIGHCLLAYALLHLFFSRETDFDPSADASEESRYGRPAGGAAARWKNRRAKATSDAETTREGDQ